MLISRRKLILGGAAAIASTALPGSSEACFRRRCRASNSQHPAAPVNNTALAIPKGFDTEPFQYYSINNHSVQIVYFQTNVYDRVGWDAGVRTVGQPSAGRYTLRAGAGQWYWTLNSTSMRYFCIGTYDRTSGEVDWFGIYDHPSTWYTLRRNGTQTEIQNNVGDHQYLPVAGDVIDVSYKNPNNTGGWTGNDFIYQVDHLP